MNMLRKPYAGPAASMLDVHTILRSDSRERRSPSVTQTVPVPRSAHRIIHVGRTINTTRHCNLSIVQNK
jgi:hypothetical protein